MSGSAALIDLGETHKNSSLLEEQHPLRDFSGVRGCSGTPRATLGPRARTKAGEQE